MKSLPLSASDLATLLTGELTVWRKMKPQPKLTPSGMWLWRKLLKGVLSGVTKEKIDLWERFAPFSPGQQVYIGETWCNINKPGIPPEIWYKLDTLHAEDYDPTEWRWRSPITMPEWAARYHATVTSVEAVEITNSSYPNFSSNSVGSWAWKITVRREG